MYKLQVVKRVAEGVFPITAPMIVDAECPAAARRQAARRLSRRARGKDLRQWLWFEKRGAETDDLYPFCWGVEKLALAC